MKTITALLLLAGLATADPDVIINKVAYKDVPYLGETAPDFTLSDPDGVNAVSLSKLTGKPVVLMIGSCT